MTLTIDLPPDLEKSVRQQAAQNGQDVHTFVLQAVKEKIAKARPFEEICAPFAQAITATGVGDEEFDRFFEEVRDDVWREKQGKAMVIREVPKVQTLERDPKDEPYLNLALAGGGYRFSCDQDFATIGARGKKNEE